MPSRSPVSVGAGIVNLRPKIIRRKTKQFEVVIEEASKGSKEVCLKTLVRCLKTLEDPMEGRKPCLACLETVLKASPRLELIFPT